MSTRIDGKAVAHRLQEKIRTEVALLKSRNITPGLAVIIVGSNPASQVYVKKKQTTSAELGFHSVLIEMPQETSEAQLLQKISELNGDAKIHGILVQLPLPKQIREEMVIAAIDPAKDVDGFHPQNVGLLSLGRPRFVPCTPKGMMHLLEAYQIPVAGKHAVIVGRSNIVGKPMGLLLLQHSATVTLCHSKTVNLPGILSQADIVVAAIGKPHFVQGSWLKPGVVALDVGINRLDNGKLVGDFDFDSAAQKAAFITPVPGGVGPMTIACLLENTLMAAQTK